MKLFPSEQRFEKWKGNFKPCWGCLNIKKKNQKEVLFALFKDYQEEDAVFLYSGKMGRYSTLARTPFATLKYKDNQTWLNKKRTKRNPLKELRLLLNEFKGPKVKEIPPFYGGAIGLFGYETFALFEEIPLAKTDDLKTPDIQVNFYDEVLVFDHLKSKLYVIVCGEEFGEVKNKVECRYGEVEEVITNYELPRQRDKKITNEEVKSLELRVERGGKKLQATSLKPQVFRTPLRGLGGVETPVGECNQQKTNFASNFSKQAYCEAIEKVKRYLVEGDTFQVNLSQRMETDLKLPAAELFKIMMEINPSPFSSYFNGGNFQIVSGSPERLVRLKNKELFTQPIAGTRKRGRNKKEDTALAQELKNSPKERAEHTMLVDLLRNDLGKVSEYGSVVTKSFAHIEKYSHVQHLVSNVYGQIAEGKDFVDVLQALFPGGTITGAPKIRTMEIISELEPTQRGPYTGSIGYIGFNGNFDLNILIRTIVCTQGKAHMQVGGGIVTDSVPEKEYEETQHKARAMLEAVAY